MKYSYFLFLLFFSYALGAFAEGEDSEEEEIVGDPPISAEITLGVLLTSGNTETESFKGQADLKHDMLHWRNHYVLEGFTKRDQVVVDAENDVTEKVRTAERYFASIQTDRKLNAENRGLFVFGSYEKDRFSGYNYQSTIAAGYSDRLFKTENSRLNYSIGPGMSFTETEAFFEEDGTFVESEKRRTGVVRLSADYLYQISETTKFTQTVASDIAIESDKNSKTKSETAIVVQINSSLALKAGYTVLYNSKVPTDIEHADTQTSVTLVFSH